MLKTILTTSAVALLSLPSVAHAGPAIAISVKDIDSNISCRNKARSKFLELGGTGLSSSTDNSQWAGINDMTANVWCRGSQVIITVAGSDLNAASELRDELKKIY